MAQITYKGTVVADPVKRQTKTGKAILEVRTAENHYRKENNGFQQTGTTWRSITLWDNAALAAAHLKKGDRVLVEGVEKTEEYQTQQGEQRTNLVVEHATVAIIPKQPQAAPQPTPQPAQQPVDPGWGQPNDNTWDQPPF